MLKISVSISNHVLRMERIPLAKHEVRLTPAEKSVKGKVYVSISLSTLLELKKNLWILITMYVMGTRTVYVMGTHTDTHQQKL